MLVYWIRFSLRFVHRVRIHGTLTIGGAEADSHRAYLVDKAYILVRRELQWSVASFSSSLALIIETLGGKSRTIHHL